MHRIVGHYAAWVLTAIIGALVVLTVVPAAVAFVPWQALMLLLVATVYLGVAMLAHNRRLCERCIAALPLDATTAAGRYTVRFRVMHLFERKLFAVGYLGALLGTAFLHDHPVGRYGWALAEASLAYLLLAYVSHQRLQPWCPYCRNGGEEQTAPTPPTPVSTSI